MRSTSSINLKSLSCLSVVSVLSVTFPSPYLLILQTYVVSTYDKYDRTISYSTDRDKKRAAHATDVTTPLNQYFTKHQTTMIGRTLLCSLLLLTNSAAVASQSYDYDQGYGEDNYGQDNLYHDYAMKQQEKEVIGGNP